MNYRRTQSQRGFVVPLFAAFSSLLVILLLGWCIDLPTHQAAVVRNQFSSDVGNATGLLKFWDPAVLPNAVNAITASANYGSFSNSPGVFFRAVNHTAIGIPEQSFTSGHSLAGALCSNSHGSTPSCEETRPDLVAEFPKGGELFDPFFQSQDDGGGMFGNLMGLYFNVVRGSVAPIDFRNGVLQYNTLNPYSYFSFLSGANRNVSTVSAIRLANTMVGVLFNPALSMGAEEFAEDPARSTYQQIFSPVPDLVKPDGSTNYVFPLAAYRKIPQIDLASDDGKMQRSILTPQDVGYPVLFGDPDETSIGTEWAENGYLMFKGFGEGFDIPFARDPSGTKHFTAEVESEELPNIFQKVFNFYSATCDSLPFFYYKSAAVNLVDRLARSSAFSSTTMIGLTGYAPRDVGNTEILKDAVIPIFPSYYPSGVTGVNRYERFVPETSYPLQVNNTGGDLYLHQKKAEAFRGWAVPHSYKSTPDLITSRPELLYCSEYYRSGLDTSSSIVSPDIAGPRTPDDFSFSSIDVAGFHHADPSSQLRSAPQDNGVWAHWYDDDYNDKTRYSADNEVASLGLHQSGGGGETPRNLLGIQALRLNESMISLLDIQDNDPPNLWTRPDLAASPDTLLTGFAYLPLAIEKMCNQVKLAANSYNQDTSYGATRPIQQTAVVVYSSQLASPVALTGLGKSLDDAVNDLRTSLQSCLCGSPNTKLILALLPFDAESTAQVTRMRSDVLYQLESAHNAQCMGVPTNQCPEGEKQGSVFTLVYDWKSPRFGGPDFPNPYDDAQAKLKAAKAFFMEVHETTTKLLMQWVYAG